MVRVIGFTGDADYWCPDHAQQVYGEDTPERKDREGNSVHPIFAHDERPRDDNGAPYDEVCNACLAEYINTFPWFDPLSSPGLPTLRE